MNIQEDLLTINPYSRPATKIQKIKGVVIHYVGNAGSIGINNRNYFESLKAGKRDSKGNLLYASSHYIIGLQGEIIRCVPESEVAYHGNSSNCNHIGIECCHPLADGKFTDDTIESLIELTADICKRQGISANSVIRHYDVTQKICPKWYVEHPQEWEKLKQKIKEYMEMPEKIEVPEWKKAGEKYLREKKITTSEHDPLELVDMGTLGIMFKNLCGVMQK